jgi:hypothetical protein
MGSGVLKLSQLHLTSQSHRGLQPDARHADGWQRPTPGTFGYARGLQGDVEGNVVAVALHQPAIQLRPDVLVAVVIRAGAHRHLFAGVDTVAVAALAEQHLVIMSHRRLAGRRFAQVERQPIGALGVGILLLSSRRHIRRQRQAQHQEGNGKPGSLHTGKDRFPAIPFPNYSRIVFK